MRTRAQSISQWLRDAALRHADDAAIVAPGRTPVTYGSLFRALDDVREALNRAGVGRGDRVALVVPDGPEMAVVSVAVAASAVCIPLNPAYRVHEYDAYLTNLAASVLLVDAHLDSPARGAARHRNIPVLDLATGDDRGTGFIIPPAKRTEVAGNDGFAAPDDTAFVLHTSGTTERPKRVPLSHANLWFRSRRRAATLELTARDRCLNLMRLYHGSGLQNLLAVLGVGGSMVCPPGPDVDAFFDWLAEYQPTWYAAPPPVHRAILSRAADRGSTVSHHSLRFIRSSSGALAPELQRQLEEAFRVPVLQAYGMTESGVVCCNPLPPRPRKPGSVGAPLNPDGAIEVATMGEAGVISPPGALGEVVVRGPAVFEGYEDDPAANAAAFRGGWYRTGDLGMLDADGYLFLKGRIKDLINRGGEKVSPREVEERLAEHPAVAEAAVFPLRHRTLGEDVAAAVVLRPGLQADERDLRRFVALTLADFKVPCRILVVDGIPGSPSGKVRRQDLAAHFRTHLATPTVAPEDPLEAALARIWAEELEVDHVGADDNFFELGGDSLRVTRMCARMQATTGHALSVATVYKWPTVAQLAKVLRQDGSPTHASSFLVPIKAEGSRPPLFCMHSRWGYADDYTQLALHLGPDQPVYGLRARGIDGGAPPHTRLDEMAAQYVEEIRGFFPRGPYLLCGYSSAGVLAWEIAQQLHAQGRRVALLALLDASLYLNPALVPARVSPLRVFRRRILFHADVLPELSSKDRLAYVLSRLKVRQRKRESAGLGQPAREEIESRQSPALRAFLRAHREARRTYLPRPYPGPVTVVLSRRAGVDLHLDPRLPGRLAAGPMEIHEVPGDHATFLKEPHVGILAKVLRECIGRAIEPVGETSDPASDRWRLMDRRWSPDERGRI